MEYPRVCIIDSSPAVRETVAVVLGGGYGVESITPEEYLSNPGRLGEVDVVVLGDDALPSESLPSLTDRLPVLWLQSRRGPPPVATGRWAAVPRMFSPEDLRIRIRALLSQRGQARAPWSTWAAVDYPIVPKESVLLVRRAIDTHLPVLICGEPGTGKMRLARAIHTARTVSRFVAVSAADCTWASLRPAGAVAPGNLTVFVNDVRNVGSEGQQVLFELLDCGGFLSDAGWHGVRLICATSETLEGLAGLAALPKDLFYRLSVLPITLPPLRERPYDIPALAHYLATELSRGISTEPTSFTPRAIHRLMHYLWFGNLAELEAVLARTLALAPTRIIDADDLLFGPTRIAPRPPAAEPAAPRSAAASAVVELIINELAHEFKNPMVTIKTFAQHMERVLTDEGGRQHAAQLAGEAVERMDRTLENLLQFTRFRAPAREDAPLRALLAFPLSDLASTLADRQLLLDYQPPDAQRAFVDSQQIVYAFASMLRAILREMVEGNTLRIRPVAGTPTVTFEFGSAHQPVAAQLAGLLDRRESGEPVTLPLGMVFAKALIERNGGRLEIHNAAGKTTITVWLPTREEIASRTCIDNES